MAAFGRDEGPQVCMLAPPLLTLPHLLPAHLFCAALLSTSSTACAGLNSEGVFGNDTRGGYKRRANWKNDDGDAKRSHMITNMNTVAAQACAA